MQKKNISKDWYFYGETSQKVDLPHDYIIRQQRSPQSPGGASCGYYPSGEGMYVKYARIPENPPHMILDLDGAYMCAEIRLNENLLAIHPHGYTPFLVDLTEKILPGKINKLDVRTICPQPSTRWYSGGGLYRDVFLWTGGRCRIEPWDLFITTPQVSAEKAEVHVSAMISSDLDIEAVVRFSVLAPDGQKVASKQKRLSLHKENKVEAAVSIPLDSPQLWDLEHPNLYALSTDVIVGGEITDTDERSFGVRSISFDAQNGFLLNGKSIKLRGGCIHHDHGVLGAACFPAAEARKLSRLKAAGFNAVRTAHNPPSLALLEYCDRNGMIVMDEAFDMWRDLKNRYDYHLWFEDWWARDISYMVLRDRNHPCVCSYSIGNEIYERDGKSDGAQWAQRLADEVRKYDRTRPVTSAVCCIWGRHIESEPEEYVLDYNDGLEPDAIFSTEPNSLWDKRTKAYFEKLDICGYNYLHTIYEHHHNLFPERVMWGSESKASEIYDVWEQTSKHPYVIGDFTWTAYDNLGEAGAGQILWARDGVLKGLELGAYPWRSCNQGDLDLCGFRRPQSYYREIVWGLRKEPAVFTTHPEHYGESCTGTGWHWADVHDDWSFGDSYIGKPVAVEVYADADEVEFRLNGRSLGKASAEKMIARMDVAYEPGCLEAIAYRNGEETGRSKLETTGEAARLLLVSERAEITADNRDLVYADVTITDAQGKRIPAAKTSLRCTVEGGELMGFFSADPANEDEYGSSECHAFKGRAVAVVRAAQPGAIRITVSADGLPEATAEITAR